MAKSFFFAKRLNQEIGDFLEFIKPSEAEEILRQHTVKRLHELVSSLWPDAVVECFGSFCTKLYLPTSDIDTVVRFKGVDQNSNRCHATLSKLGHSIIERGISTSKNVEILTAVRVPLVKYVDEMTRFSVDVSFNSESGPNAAVFIVEQLKDRVIGRVLKGIVLIIKQFLYQRRLEKVYVGGLGGYSVFLMVLSFLKFHPKIQLGLINPNENIGILLLEFFELYGRLLNTRDVALSFNSRGMPMYVDKNRLELLKRPRQTGICIIDPMNSKNDICGGTFAWGVIKREFKRAFMLICAVLGKLHENTLRTRFDPSREGNPPRGLNDDSAIKASTILGMILDLDEYDVARRKEVKDLWPNLAPSLLKQDVAGSTSIRRTGKTKVRKFDEYQSSSGSSHNKHASKRQKVKISGK